MVSIISVPKPLVTTTQHTTDVGAPPYCTTLAEKDRTASLRSAPFSEQGFRAGHIPKLHGSTRGPPNQLAKTIVPQICGLPFEKPCSKTVGHQTKPSGHSALGRGRSHLEQMKSLPAPWSLTEACQRSERIRFLQN